MKKKILLMCLTGVIGAGCVACGNNNTEVVASTAGQEVSSETKEAEVTSSPAGENNSSVEVDYEYEVLDDGTINIYSYEVEGTINEVTIPDEIDGKTVTGIESLFYGESSVQKVVIPETVTVIGDDTFYNAESIETIEILGNIKSVGDNAFSNCEKLKELSLGSDLEYLGEYAIAGCPELTEVHIGSSEVDGALVTNFIECSADLVVYAPDGSTIEQTAEENGIAFQAE